MKPFLNYVFFKSGSSSLWLARRLDGQPNVEALADPDNLLTLPGCEVIKDQRKIKVARVPIEIGGQVKWIYVKRYNVFSWRYRLGSLFACSAAVRSLAGAEILKEAGFRTGEPVAAVEVRSAGILTKSFYLSEEISGGKTADAYWREELLPVKGPTGFDRRRKFLKSLAELFRSLHDARIYHNDLKDANILVWAAHGQESFYLLDLEGIRKGRYLNPRRRVKNLVQLNRTFGALLTVSRRLFWLREYLGESFLRREERRRFIQEILSATGRKERRKLKKKKRQELPRGSTFDKSQSAL